MAVSTDTALGSTRDAERRTGRTRVAVFRGLPGIGDFLVAVPALRVLRASLPEAVIGLIARESVRELGLRFGDLFDEFLPFHGWPGLEEAGEHARNVSVTEAAAETSAQLPEWRGCGVAIQMHGDGTTSNGFCAWLEPEIIIAYGPQPTVAHSLIDTRSYPRELREVERCHLLACRAVKSLGATPVDDDLRLRFEVTDRDRQEAQSILANGAALHATPAGATDYFVIHPGSKRPDSRWPTSHFGQVGRTLSKYGRVVITGTRSEKGIAEEVAALTGANAACLAGCLSLGGLAALIEGAAGVVTNDTGVSHLADAVGTRSVVVFMASDPHRWAPRDESLHLKAVAPAAEGEEGTLTPEGVHLVPPPVSSVLDAAMSVGMIH